MDENKYFSNVTEYSDVVSLLTKIFYKFQIIHPFREGNTRSSKSFISVFGKTLGYLVNWTHMTEDESMKIKIVFQKAKKDKANEEYYLKKAESYIGNFIKKDDNKTAIDIFSGKCTDEVGYQQLKTKTINFVRKINKKNKKK